DLRTRRWSVQDRTLLDEYDGGGRAPQPPSTHSRGDMMRQYGLMAVVILALGCRIGSVPGSGTVKQESREVADFTSVEVGSVVHATVRVGPKAPIVLEGDDNLLPL